MQAITHIESDDLASTAEIILSEAKKRGATEAEVAMSANKGFSAKAHEGDVETVEYNQDKSVDITVYFGKRVGSASLSDLRPEAIKAAVEAACHIAKFTDEDPAAGLADKEDMAFDYPQLELGKPWHLSVDQAIKLACECEREARSIDKRITCAEEATVETANSTYLYANTHGFIGQYDYASHDISCVLVAKENGLMQRDYYYTSATDPSLLLSAKDVATRAAERTLSRLGARKIKTTKAPVIFMAEEARGLIGTFMSAISGGAIYRKSSFLLDCVGKQIFPDFMHIQEHPHLPYAIGSEPFDNDGVRTRDNIFVDQGVLQMYSLGTYSARKLGLKSCGNAGGAHNLVVRTGNKTLPELLKEMGRGLLITELMGQGVKLVTGDYSRGVGGFWVENGEIQYPVHEITVASNLRDMFARIKDIGNDVDERGNVRTGSILIEEMMIAGQ